MLKDRNNQLNIYSGLYHKIPQNHTLRLINETIDFSVLSKPIEKLYSKYYGRPAVDPELMIRLLILQTLYRLSDERVIEEASLNLAYMWFLGINPDDECLPHPSLLSKFRTKKLDEGTLDEILVYIIKQCVTQGIIKDTGISIDSTHTQANTFKATPERVMKKLAKKLFKTFKEEIGELPETVNQVIPEYNEIDDPKVAKQVMKGYLEGEIHKIEQLIDIEKNSETLKQIKNAKEILVDPKFIEQKGVRSIVDQDARVGYKSKTESFFGYKIEYMMTVEDKIITAVSVNNGAYVDGTNFEEQLKLTQKTGLSIKEFYADKAYFRKKILDKIAYIEAIPYIPVSEMVYRIDEEKFSYNKDSDEWFCSEGNKSISKTHKESKDGRETYQYKFEREKCRTCGKRRECDKSKSIARVLKISINTPEFYEYSQRQKTEEFKEMYKKRACQEGKNGELKNHHGLDRARGYGLRSMSTQAKLTAIAVNLKRIANILSSNLPILFCFLNRNVKIQEEI